MTEGVDLPHVALATTPLGPRLVSGGQQNHARNELLTQAFHFAVDGGFSHAPSLGRRNRQPCGSEAGIAGY